MDKHQQNKFYDTVVKEFLEKKRIEINKNEPFSKVFKRFKEDQEYNQYIISEGIGYFEGCEIIPSTIKLQFEDRDDGMSYFLWAEEVDEKLIKGLLEDINEKDKEPEYFIEKLEKEYEDTNKET